MPAFVISQIQGHCQHWVLRASTAFGEGSFSHPCPVKKYFRKYEIFVKYLFHSRCLQHMSNPGFDLLPL